MLKAHHKLTAAVQDWDKRHEALKDLGDQIKEAETTGRTLLFRGQREFDEQKGFILGEKPHPLMPARRQERERHRLAANKLTKDRDLFEELTKALSVSQAYQQSPNAGPRLIELWESMSEPTERFELAQVVLCLIHWMNSSGATSKYRAYSYGVSFTRDAKAALKYATSPRNQCRLPHETYILEYCPPQSHVKPIGDLLTELDELGLETSLPDKDNEVLAMYGALPHYLVGVAHLHHPRTTSPNVIEYQMRYIRNPHLTEPHTILKPPDLGEPQRRLAAEFDGLDFAWFESCGPFQMTTKTGETLMIRPPKQGHPPSK